ncbi:flagellar hook-length control protein FliK [Stutzerimonas stutzeri]|uniref:Flagellar hook-length control protein FliK n=1 Tax=Stutzerimonas stutzeri TaxID=316 RepID=W8RCH7_STUST|nr:flagellar hook-length control protein FliK [Stutzerimonas stutzeri]AHL76167.1 flagellar hook-length control protein FliK [Stutzerimonas stutzeri]MCQ4329389.1 flagellar hook-length control protein FliK [Stutzerimonas stutzeri]
MTEIKSTQAIPSSGPSRPVTNSAELALKLLQPMQGLLIAGESAEAEVVSIKEALQSFQLTLRLTLTNGRQATVETSSPRAAVPGTAMLITAVSDTRLMAALQPGNRQPQGSIDLTQLPVGSVVQGKVTASQQTQQDGKVVFKVVISLLNSPLAGQKLNVESAIPLAPGNLVTARVQGDQSLSFMPLSGRLDQLVLGQQLTAQHNRQGSIEGLLGALGSGNRLPEQLRGAAERLLGLVPDMRQLGDAKTLAQALARSGVFLEGSLLSGQESSLPTDMKAALLRLIAQLPGLPGGGPAAAQAGAALGQALPAFARNALGALGQPNIRQLAQSFPLPSRLLPNAEEEPDLELLLKLAAAAVSRLQTHQLSSLAQTQTSPDGTQVTTWQIEVPMRDQRDIVPLQVKFQREEEPQHNRKEKPDILWKVELAFDVAPLGPLQVQAQLLQGSLSSQIWAERSGTADLISAELDHLRQRLVTAGLNIGELACRQGTPPQGPRTSLDQLFVDETA